MAILYTLKSGSSGPQVEMLQLALKRAGFLQGNIDVMGKACFHLSVVKYQCAKNVRYGFHVFHPDLL